jgi:lipopolysaccharide transport system ATP-binding protein
MTAQIVVEGLSKRYQLGQRAALPRLDIKAHALNAVRRLRGRQAIPLLPTASESLWALRDVSFEVEQGQRLGIIGRNGSGKSTLLKILSRITDPTEGRARLRGRVGSLLEVGTGFHPDLTGRENILLNGAVLGMTRTEIRRKFDEIVDFAEIEQFLDVPVKHYSSGMYVRLAFAVAAHLESEILIVDEVLSVGDAAFQRKCMGKMENVGDNGRTVLFVSHATSTVTRLCTHGLLLDHGQVKAYGHAADIVHEYLGRQMSSRTVYELPPNPRQPMALRKVHLNPDAKEPSNELSYEDDIVVCIEYEVNKELEDAVVWFAMQTMEGEYVFVSADHDIDQSMLGVRKPGYYRAELHVPGKWLNVGEYLIVVGLNKNRPVERYNREDTVSFKILDIGTPARLTWDGGRPGVIQPYLKWETRAD